MSNIKNYVEIGFEINYIQIDRDLVSVKISPNSLVNPPNNSDNIRSIVWDNSKNYNPMHKGAVNYFDGDAVFFDEEKYNDWVQPYVDIWQAEKDRIEQEQQQAQEEYAKFENRKERALTQITDDYHSALERGFVRTSLGFDADINPESVATLLGTQTSLVYTMRTFDEKAEAPKTVFRDFYGLKRELDAVKVERLICEINGAQNHIRELKYKFKDQVKDTYDNDSLNTVIDQCVYSTLDYSNGEPVVLPFVSTHSIKDRIDRW